MITNGQVFKRLANLISTIPRIFLDDSLKLNPFTGCVQSINSADGGKVTG
jgi:hypothetical protein